MKRALSIVGLLVIFAVGAAVAQQPQTCEEQVSILQDFVQQTFQERDIAKQNKSILNTSLVKLQSELGKRLGLTPTELEQARLNSDLFWTRLTAMQAELTKLKDEQAKAATPKEDK